MLGEDQEDNCALFDVLAEEDFNFLTVVYLLIRKFFVQIYKFDIPLKSLKLFELVKAS
jgi:hypothetical protein